MNMGFIGCVIGAAAFFVIAIIFATQGEKAALMVPGFDTVKPEDRYKYDTALMCKDYKNRYLLWAIVMAAGALYTGVIGSVAVVVSVFIVVCFMFKDMRNNGKMGYRRYLKQEFIENMQEKKDSLEKE